MDYTNVLINWINDKLKPVNLEIKDLKEFATKDDGGIVKELIQVLTQKEVPEIKEQTLLESKSTIERTYANMLLFLRQENTIHSSSEEGSFDRMRGGDINHTKNVLRILIKHYHIGQKAGLGKNASEIIHAFVKSKIGHKSIDMKEYFTPSDWNNGTLLSMLVNSIQPGLIPNADHLPAMPIINTRKALAIAEKHLGIPQIILTDQLSMGEDAMSVMTYLAYFLERNLPVLGTIKKELEMKIQYLNKELSDKKDQCSELEQSNEKYLDTNHTIKKELEMRIVQCSELEESNEKLISAAKDDNEIINSLKEEIKEKEEQEKEKLLESYEKDKVKRKLEKEKDAKLKKIETDSKTYIEKANALSKRVEEELNRFAKVQQEKILLQNSMKDMAIRLKVNDLYEVMLETANIQSQWEEIGEVLKVPHNELKSIADNNSSLVTRCHYEMMRYWILNIGGSWKGLADALRNEDVKQEKLAKQIMENYGNGKNKAAQAHFIMVKDEAKVFESTEVLSCDIFTHVDWKVLGLLLGLSDSTLESIQDSCSSPEECQQSMIDHWISTGHAHWSVLVDVLEGPVFGETELADEIAKKHFKDVRIQARGENGPVGEGVYTIDDNIVKDMKKKILTAIGKATKLRDGKQVKGIIFVFAMTEVQGARIDFDNVTKTFQDHLNFAVYRVEDIQGVDLANFIKAAATYEYPISCKIKAFYFAGHGGIDKDKRPFFKPVDEDDEKKVFLIHENILHHFKNTKPKDKFLFFFDCCLSQAKSDQDASTTIDDGFSLEAPVRCLIAYATSVGIQSFGDNKKGGRWTSCLCKNLEKQIELGVVLSNTHEEVMKMSKDEQPPNHRSCIGPIYLKGKPEPSVQQKDVEIEKSKQNVLKRNHSDLFKILDNNRTVLTSLATALSMESIIDQKFELIIHENEDPENTTLLLNRLEEKLDKQPGILSILFRIMEHFEGELRTCVIGMREETKDIDEDTITTDLARAFNESKTENEILKERLKTLKQEKEQQMKNADYSINADLKKELKKMVEFVQKFTD